VQGRFSEIECQDRCLGDLALVPADTYWNTDGRGEIVELGCSYHTRLPENKLPKYVSFAAALSGGKCSELILHLHFDGL